MKRLLCFLLLALGGYIPALALLPDSNPLTSAASAGDSAAVNAALTKGAAIEERNAEGWTPLICAVNFGRTEIVRLLLSKHANPSALTASGCSPLDFALEQGRDEMVTLLLTAGANLNAFTGLQGDEPRSPLFRALHHHKAALITQLLAHGARLEAKSPTGDTALMAASRLPFTDQVRLLIEHGADVNAHGPNGHTALIYAAYNDRDEIVSLLLEKGANPQATASDGPGEKSYGALEVAIEQGRPYVLEALDAVSAKPVHPKNQLNEDLNEALNRGDYERAQAALVNGASPNAANGSDVLPLTVAALTGNPAIVELLIKAGADVNANPGNDPRTTFLADARQMLKGAKTPQARERYQRVAELLQKAGATR